MSTKRRIGANTHVQNESTASGQDSDFHDLSIGDRSSLVALDSRKSEPRVDSRLIAKSLGVQSRSVMQQIGRYADMIRQFGHLPFKKELGRRAQGGGNPERFALLNEGQSFFVLSLSRNTRRVVELKARLVHEFREARQIRDLTDQEYLPTYQHLHKEISALAAGSSNQRLVHMNVNRLLNSTVGCPSGGRQSLPLLAKAMLVTAQVVAANAMHGAEDHRDGYRRAKSALEKFGMLALGAPGRQPLASESSGFVTPLLAACLAVLAVAGTLLQRGW